ncbi:protein translocase subunit yidC [Dongia mobilis]|uniref:Membrane protein insertase YidC n=1 Tax=Dongia mobilis TaxID=578943 RepID=A0A4R6WTT3_9PROT|nr:membrane protein insertase YidC [Dongia mobilis]TDQ82300.1 protein translocase subunit yidC [Dongia mobilis]
MNPQIDKKNMVIAIALSMAIIFVWQFFFEMPRMERQRAEQALLAEQQAAQQTEAGQLATPQQPAAADAAGNATGGAPLDLAAATAKLPRDEALALSPRVRIDAPKIRGSVALKGGRIDDLVLKNYRETIELDSPNVVLLSPARADLGYFAETGWVAVGNVKTPDAEAIWTADRDTLSPDSPVTLTWDNGEGLVFTRRITVDQDYMFDIVDSVTNNGSAAVSLAPYSRVKRIGLPPLDGIYILHEGPMGVLEGSLNEHTYGDIRDQALEAPVGDLAAAAVTASTTGGWLGLSDKYWLAAQVIPADAPVKARMFYGTIDDSYQVDYTAGTREVAPGAAVDFDHKIFAGAKEVSLLEHYRDTFNIPLFERAVDFGYFFFLTQPLHAFLDWIFRFVGNMGIAILLLTVVVKAVMFPLANKSYVSMSKMKTLQPKMQELKETYGDDKQRFQQEMMALYKKEKVNPAAGCLPILIQIPVFYALYKVLYVTIDMRHAPFFGWIDDLSVKDPTTVLNLFGLIPWDPSAYFSIPILGLILSFLSIGVWPLVMGFTMWAQMRLNPTPPDPIQARLFAIMPFMFTFMLAPFAAGLVIYWAWNNTLSIAQQKFIMWKLEKAKEKQAQKAGA